MPESTKQHMETETTTSQSTNRRGDPNYPICETCANGTWRMMGFNIIVQDVGSQSSPPSKFMCCNKRKQLMSSREIRHNKCPINSFNPRTTEIKSK